MNNYDLCSLRLIKNDVDDILNIFSYTKNKEYYPIFILCFLPYLSQTISESNKFFRHKDKTESNDYIDYYQVFDKPRMRIKILDSQYRKSKNIVKNIDHTKNLEFASKLKFFIPEKFNIHYNIGIYFINSTILSNTHLLEHYTSPYLFDNLTYNRIKELYEEGKIPTEEEKKHAFINIGTKSSSFLATVSKGLSNNDFLKTQNCVFFNKDIKIDSRDYNTNICFKSKYFISEFKVYYLIILDLISVLNFVIYLYDKVVKIDNGLSIRIKYNVYDNTLKVVNQLTNHLEREKKTSNNIYKLLLEVNNNSNISLINKNFGNIIRHYGIVENEIQSSLTLNTRLCGLTENYFPHFSVNEYEKILDKNINMISEKLSLLFVNLKRP